MNTAPNPSFQYQVGGSLDKNAPSYVWRQGDKDFYGALKRGEFCYVLNCRQMGKSSLRVRTMQRLQADNIACGVIDITSIGSHDIEPSQWYLSVIRRLAASFRVFKTKEVEQWWNERHSTPVDRLSEFIEDVLLIKFASPGQIVIFIDEIDSILPFSFKDDFFALIRACYNQRADNPEYYRLTFALLGVATPSDLIEDKNRTPFNIGTDIDLKGFDLSEVFPLEKGLEKIAAKPHEILKAILYWTEGQPFLTQKICQLGVKYCSKINLGSEREKIEELVISQIIENWEDRDQPDHLKTIRERLISKQRESITSRLLGLYQEILQAGSIKADGSPEQMELRLTGLVVQREGNLKVYNRIYEQVFNQQWVKEELNKLRPYSEAISAWLESKKQDKSRLLKGQTLEEALQWRRGKLLSGDDEEFLRESQQQEREIERQEKEILAKAHKNATRLLLFSSGFSLLLIVTSVLVGIKVTLLNAEAQAVIKINLNVGLSPAL